MREEMLTEELLNRYPVWTWTSDREAYTPVSGYDPPPSDLETLFIRSRFWPCLGETLVGYVTGDVSEEVGFFHSFCIIHKQESFPFNASLPDLNREMENELRRSLSHDEFQLFPVHYKTWAGFRLVAEFSGGFVW